MAVINRLSDELHQKALGWTPSDAPLHKKQSIETRLRPFGLDEVVDRSEVVNLPYPDQLGTWKEALDAAVEIYGRPHIERLQRLSDAPEADVPGKYPTIPGWYTWDASTGLWMAVKGMPEGVYVLDFETVRVHYEKGLWYPVTFSAWGLPDGSDEGQWYAWVWDPKRLVSVIELPGNSTFVGHNVTGYDRQYSAKEYLWADSGSRWVDTMALWIATRGMGNQQRVPYKALKDSYGPRWVDETAMASLAEVYKFYFNEELNKDTREILVELSKGLHPSGNGRLSTLWADRGFSTVYDAIKAHLQEIGLYNLSDIRSTHKVFRYLYPEMRYNQPSDVSLTAQLLISNFWVSLDADRWPTYYDRAEKATLKILSEISGSLRAVVEETVSQYDDQLQAIVRSLKGVKDKAAYVAEKTAEFVSGLPLQLQALDWTPATTGANKGKPKWYRDIKGEYTLTKKWVPLVLRMTFRGAPILLGDVEGTNGKGEEGVFKGYYTEQYGPLPHPEKRGQVVTGIFTKGYDKYSDMGLIGVLEGASTIDTGSLLKKALSTLNWVSFRERAFGLHVESPEGFPVTLPLVLPTGTTSRRAADKVFQVMANPKEKRIGTEFKSIISPPKGYTFVGGDVDQQEAVIFAAIGDSLYGYNGATPLAVSVLLGSKADKTDIHSLGAAEAQISRDDAKNTLVYPAMYFSGIKGCTDGLMKVLPTAPVEECRLKATNFIDRFKGTKNGNHYVGGLASDGFNAIMQYISQPIPRTPVLGAAMSLAVSSAVNDFLTTKGNYIVQSSGVDYRDILVVLQRYLYDLLGVEGRLMLTIHDEIRTIVKDGDEIKAAYALQIANMLVRAAFIDSLGLDFIPSNSAWLSAIDIDPYALRKDPEAACVTPTQPDPLPPGRTVTPKQLLELL